MILTELDVYADALKKINLNEEVMPIYKGRVLTENVDIYCKIQKLLGCRPMEGCHRFLYDLDVENLDESECTKVNNLYNLGIERGYIVDDTAVETTPNITTDQQIPQVPETPVTTPTIPQPQTPEIPTSAYTVVYSAMRNGEIKTGEAYSNAINTRSAKADIISKLEKAGYQNISILAIEAGDPDMSGCDNTFCKQPDAQIDVPDVSNIQDEAEENSPLISALDDEDGNGLKISSANVCDTNAAKITVREADKKDEKDTTDDETKDDSSEEDTKEKDTEDTKKDSSDKKEEKAEEPDEKLKDNSNDTEEDSSEETKDNTDKKTDKKELSDQEKSQFKDSYKKAFKAAMLKCQFEDKCFDDLTLEEKVKFFTELDKAWKSKPDPIDFLSDKETEQLEKIVIKK